MIRHKSRNWETVGIKNRTGLHCVRCRVKHLDLLLRQKTLEIDEGVGHVSCDYVVILRSSVNSKMLVL